MIFHCIERSIVEKNAAWSNVKSIVEDQKKYGETSLSFSGRKSIVDDIIMLIWRSHDSNSFDLIDLQNLDRERILPYHCRID
jgi:hypothetical protein